MQQNELDKMKHTVEKQRHLILNSEDKNEKKLNQISRILDEFEEETELLKDQMKDRFSDFEILIKSKIKIQNSKSNEMIGKKYILYLKQLI